MTDKPNHIKYTVEKSHVDFVLKDCEHETRTISGYKVYYGTDYLIFVKEIKPGTCSYIYAHGEIKPDDKKKTEEMLKEIL